MRPELTVLCVDAAQNGVGGIDSWGARPLEEHLIASGSFAWGFVLRPFDSSSGDPPPSALARTNDPGLCKL